MWDLRSLASPAYAAVVGIALATTTSAAEPTADVIPYNQDQAPGPALSPAEAAQRMTVPPGFKVEVVAAEPDLVNPVAMAFDERGRVWVCESLEYPRFEPGEGRDRIKVLEDTNADGRADRFTVFAEGLNIPSGIAVGYGGVWVANSPDILFLQDTDGDLRADRREVVLTGFGRRDTHELPNSLTWGPDGWLYGLNGVFNHSEIKHQGREYRFNCAMWRLHPRTRAFELFAEGTSNPWGIAFDHEGSAFVSACVVDHLWHLVETGYYHRQAGAYPPFTWKLGSIVEYGHQKAAYCGIHYFDSDAYPPEYRDRLYMGNIHGGCINVDRVHRAGASYRGEKCDDFLTARDAWFMPVAQKTGPDGCLYILDWYDRYHCYQDARRDSDGIDRGHGRLYRVRYNETPRAAAFDLAHESDELLIARLASPNCYFRDQAQRLLGERTGAETDERLQSLVLDAETPLKTRMHALFARLARGSLPPDFHLRLLTAREAPLRAWGVRAAGNMGGAGGTLDARVAARVLELAHDDAPDVQLQVAIAARKVPQLPAVDGLVDVLVHCGDDPTIPPVVWRNLEPVAVEQAETILARLGEPSAYNTPGVAALAPRLLERLLVGEVSPTLMARWIRSLLSGENPSAAGREVLRMLATKIDNGVIAPDLSRALHAELADLLVRLAEGPARHEAVILAASWGDERFFDDAQALLKDAAGPVDERLRSLAALIVAGQTETAISAIELLDDDANRSNADFVRGALLLLGRLDHPAVAEAVLAHYDTLDPAVRPQAVDLLCQRAHWGKLLLARIATGDLPAAILSANQARRLQGFRDEELARLIADHWGTVRQQRDAARERVVAQMRDFLESATGNAQRGAAAFNKVCAQCHKFRGEGADVGPDLTTNGRGSFEQLLSNVFDPSLVIGAAYQARTVVTVDGRAITGLTVEDGQERLVLKVQGGKFEVIPRDQIDASELSPLSLMPEGVENQLSRQEIVDLFVYLLEDAGGLP